MKKHFACFVFAGVLISSNAIADEWRYNHVEGGVQVSPDSIGAVFSYSHMFPILPVTLSNHLGLEMKLSAPPLIPNMMFCKDAGQYVAELSYGAKIGPAIQFNRFVSFSVVGGVFGGIQARVYADNVNADTLTGSIFHSGSVDVNAAIIPLWGLSVEPKLRINLGALTLGASVDFYKNDRDIAPLTAGVYIKSPLETMGVSASNINTDNLGKYSTVEGVWRTRYTITAGVSF